jgi:hypothetical protein
MGMLVMDQGMMTLVTIGIIAICAAIALYIIYSVIWRAVRRGLVEFNATLAPAPVKPHPEPQVRSMRLHLPHRTSIKVPNYLPSDWV